MESAHAAQREGRISDRSAPSASANRSGQGPELANQLADLSDGRAIDYSDVWTDEDLADATSAALRRFEILEQHPFAPESE